MALGKVMSRGQITLPREVRQRAHIEPGDVLNIEVVGPGEVRVSVLPNLSPRELRARYPIEGPIDEAGDRQAWQEEAVRNVLGGTDA
ncbi:MAG TPA: AbrB/MazE/SpoVT family DNA-binding domain-containing protein [Chloroflexota bacterium]|nr:AbrB/MazE/SpoVT family DNA-binding domain-containing protein [Chloroflexota bacterium]